MTSISIQTAYGQRYVRTSVEGGVHLPHNFARLIDRSGTEYSPGHPVPVDISDNITVSGDAINLSLSHTSSSITIWGNRQSDGAGSPYAVVVTPSGAVTVSVTDGLTQEVDTSPITGDEGVVFLAIRQDSPTALADDGNYAPLQVDANGSLRVSLGTEGVSATVTLAALSPSGSPGSLTFVDGILTAKSDPS